MKGRNKILLVIHTPPPFGGGEMQAMHIKEYFSKNPDFLIYDYRRKNHSRSDWEKASYNVIKHGLIWILKVSCLIIRYRPIKMYFTLPKSYLAFIRNMSVLPLAHLFKVKVYGELPGTSFLFLKDEKSFRYKTGLTLLRQIDEIRFLSPSIAGMHEKYRLKHTVVINNGVEIPSGFSVRQDVFYEDYLQLVYVGAIESMKGVFNILEAVKICNEENIKIHFNFIGYWVYESEKHTAQQFIEENNLKKLFTFHGIKTGQDKWDILSKCAILVHPTYWDGVPLTILEALGIGMPVISTSIGGIPDTMTNEVNGIILSENTPEKLAAAIEKYYK